jgi:hypothetical protein
VDIRHLATNSNNHCTWQRQKVTSHHFARPLLEIHCQLFSGPHYLLPCQPHFPATCLPNYVHLPTMNVFSMVQFIQSLLVLECHRMVRNRCLPVKGSILQLFQIILPADNDPMLSFEQPGHIHSLPVVEHTVVGLPPPFRKFVQGEFGTHQAE